MSIEYNRDYYKEEVMKVVRKELKDYRNIPAYWIDDVAERIEKELDKIIF